MSIPSSIITALSSLEAQVQAAQPLANAPHSSIIALQLNAGNLVNNIQTTLTTANNLLDNNSVPTDPPSMIVDVLNVLGIAQDQSNLSLMRGVVGRVASNLDQL